MSGSKRLRVAVVGCGIGRSHIEEGYLNNPDLFEIAALCDINPERLNAAASDFGVERRVADFRELLEMDDIDLVDICTPPLLHFEQVKAALSADKHVICEKPLVGSLAQVDEIMAAESRSNGRLMPIFQYRFGNGVAQARAIIEAGLAGRPYLGTVETFWKRTADYYSVPWRGKFETELGGVLVSHAIHIHDMAMWLMGPLERVFGRTATRVNAIEVEDCASASCLLQSGALLSLSATLGSQDEISRMRLSFENITFESDHAPYRPGEKLWRILPKDEGIKSQIDSLLADWVDVPSRFATQVALFHEAVTTGGPLPVTSQDARNSIELVTAFYHSSSTGEDVALPLTAVHPRYSNWRPAT
jgi:predicted dehydrogenase